MNEFWLWFWRPIAETLGAFALLAGAFLALYIYAAITLIWRRIKAKRTGTADNKE